MTEIDTTTERVSKPVQPTRRSPIDRDRYLTNELRRIHELTGRLFEGGAS